MLVCALFCGVAASAQQYVTTLGLQYKPIIPSSILRNDGFEFEDQGIKAKMNASTGSSFGMVVRKGLNHRFSIDAGINMITRKYKLEVSKPDTGLSFTQDFKWVTFEIPVQLLVFIRLGEKLYLNAGAGPSFVFYPSDVDSFRDTYNQSFDFYHQTYRSSWIQIPLIANLGFEYRTESSGYFYLGATYSQPFNPMAQTRLRYLHSKPTIVVSELLRGNYLTIDLRYYFHQDPKPYKATKSKKKGKLKPRAES